MKTIEITYTRKITFNNIIEVEDAIADKALALDEMDLTAPRIISSEEIDPFYLITEQLVDETTDIYSSDDEIENLSVTLYKPKSNPKSKSNTL